MLDMSAPQKLSVTAHAELIETLFISAPAPTNADLSLRVQIAAEDTVWQASKIPGLSLCVLEYLEGSEPRMTALARVEPDSGGVSIPAAALEILVQHGLVADSDSEYLHPHYLRHPRSGFNERSQLILHAGSQSKNDKPQSLEFYIATGQLADTDTERRSISLSDHGLWLPGPVEHTEVMPLHMHNGNNSMLVRWQEAVSFRPRLDPLGEEVLVIDGMLGDQLGSYTEGSWIRNPITSWQGWAGIPGTMIYYKNGHFGQTVNTADQQST